MSTTGRILVFIGMIVMGSFMVAFATTHNKAEAQVRQIHMESPVQETTLSDGTRCAYIYERQQGIATLTCDW